MNLRPDFTELIFQKLFNGFSGNVYANEGQGKTQLIDDLIIKTSDSAKIVRINMKSYFDSYAGFMRDIGNQIGIATSQATDEIGVLFTRHIQESTGKTFLIFDDFDRLFQPGIDPKFNVDFVNYLNSLRNNRQVGLLLFTQKSISTQGLYFNGKLDSGSKIEAERITMPPLSMSQIETALLAKSSYNNDLHQFLKKKKNQHILNLYVSAVYKNKYPYSFLNFIIGKIDKDISEVTDVEQCLTNWQQTFEKEGRASTSKQIQRFSKGVNSLRFHTNELFTSFKILQNVNRKWVIIISIIAGIGAAIFGYWEKIVNFLNF